MIEKIKNELRYIEEGIRYMEDTDTAYHPTYTKLLKERRILKKAIRKLERLEAKSK
jgi:hypothetical protein